MLYLPKAATAVLGCHLLPEEKKGLLPLKKMKFIQRMKTASTVGSNERTSRGIIQDSSFKIPTSRLSGVIQIAAPHLLIAVFRQDTPWFFY
jgi:hypothetical protein